MGMYVDKGIDMCVNMSKAQEGVHQPEHPRRRMQPVPCSLHNCTWIRQHLLRKSPLPRPCVGGAASEHAARRPQESSPKAECGS